MPAPPRATAASAAATAHAASNVHATATATLQTCVVTPVEGESIEDRRERCRAEHREDRVGPGGCREIYNEAYKSCTDGERQRYVDCMGDC